MTYRLAQDENGFVVLTTARLRLRRPGPQDTAPGFAFWSSPRSHMMGGPWTMEQFLVGTADLHAQWAKHGFSLFTVTRHGSDDGIGGIGPFYPDTHPEPEIGWSLWNQADEGQGLAHEAAVATRDWFFDTSGFDTAVSHTDPQNHRSNRLCERLGGVVDPDAPHPYGDEPNLVWRYRKGAA